MKKIVVAGLLVAGVSLASAQGYVGALLALTKLHTDCMDGGSCGSKPLGFKIYGGVRYSDVDSLHLGIGAVDTLEVGAVRFGSREGTWATTKRVYDSTSFTGARTVPAVGKASVSADALYAAVGAHVPLVRDLSFTPKLGIAWVTTTRKSWVDDVSQGSVSENHLAPYLGLGLEYSPIPVLKLQASVDLTHVKTEGASGVAHLLGLGAAVAF